MEVFCQLSVWGAEGPTRHFSDRMYVDDDLNPPFDLNRLVPRGSIGPIEAWGSPVGAFNTHCADTTARPLVLQFESLGYGPDELVRRLSDQHPELVFALEFRAEQNLFFGWSVFAAGTLHGDFFSPETCLSNRIGTDFTLRQRELEHPEVALIDGVEATEWAGRYMAACQGICRQRANAVGLADEVREMESQSRHIGEIDPVIATTIPANYSEVIDLDEFEENVNFHKARVECRLAVKRVLEAKAAAWEGVM